MGRSAGCMSEVVFVAHKTLADGTSHEVTGGKTMDGGTVYDIAFGKTLLNGTAYEIAFGISTIKVTITGSVSASYGYVTINGTRHTYPTTLEIEPGTTIQVSVKGSYGGVYLNDTKVVSGSSLSMKTYTFVPDTESVNIALSYNSGNSSCTIRITTS